MGYALEAVIAPTALLSPFGSDLVGAGTVALGHGLVLLPVTEKLARADDRAADHPAGFVRLTAPLVERAAAWSRRGPVAYVEAEFFGGWGTQAAVVWHRGAPVLGPLRQEEGEPAPEEGTPISRALRHLGVATGPDDRDEFDAVGLGAHRSTEGWALRATPLEAP
ncbi:MULTISPECIES: hypothetical protein [unclassified Nocardiopsis]|uniref:hypothetical protein n=1 Tax=unclassified Nocardiopsis TaxID=2649073 RepID=UPI0033FCA8DB